MISHEVCKSGQLKRAKRLIKEKDVNIQKLREDIIIKLLLIQQEI